MAEEKYFSSKEIIKKQLNIVIFNKRTKQMLKNDQFLSAVIKNVSILKKIEEITGIEKEKMISYKYLDRINVELAEKKTFISVEIPDSTAETNDEIKFLDSLSINLFSKNLEQIKILASDSSSVLPFDSSTFQQNNATNSNDEKKKSSNNSQGTSGSYDYGYNETEQKEQIIMQMAAKRLSQEIGTGKVYLYLSKPTAVPIIKFAVSIFYGFIALINLAFIIFFAYISISKISYSVFVLNGVIVPPPTTDTGATLVNIFGSGQFSISLIINILFVIFFPIMAVKNLRGMKTNDNIKYSMSLFFLSFLSILGLFNLIQIFSSGDPFSVLRNAELNPSDVNQDQNLLAIYEAYIILNITISGGTVLGFAFIIPYMALKPKRNIQLQQDLLNKYKEEIKSGGIVK